jgi:hypothetical protein
MPEHCEECKKRDIRIEQLEAMIERMAESADKLLKKGEEVEEKVKAAGNN